jgi:hypothetical protein
MDQSSNEIQREREQTRAALTEKIELLEECVRDTKKAVKQKFDYRYQTERQPWKMLGVSVALGYLFGRVVGSGSSARSAVARESQTVGRPQKDRFKSALMGAVVPMLVEFVKTASFQALSTRDRPSDSRSHGRTRVPPSDDERAVPPKIGEGTTL